MSQRRDLPRLMLVGGPGDAQSSAVTTSAATTWLRRVVGDAVVGGLRLFQLRDRVANEDQLLPLVEGLQGDCPELKIVVNGRPGLAQRAGGLHLPEHTALPAEWLTETLWGRSVHGVEAAVRAEAEGAHYLVLGTIFGTPSKPGYPGAGVARVREVCRAVTVPVYAIGGIDASKVHAVIAAGAHGVAVKRAVLASGRPSEAVGALVTELTSEAITDVP